MAYGAAWILLGGREHGSARVLAVVVHLGLVQLGALALWAPLPVRNLLVLGSPLHPALPELFGGAGMDSWSLRNVLGTAVSLTSRLWLNMGEGIQILGGCMVLWVLALAP